MSKTRGIGSRLGLLTFSSRTILRGAALAGAVAAFVAIAVPSASAADGWVASEVTGQVTVQLGDSPAKPVLAGEELAPGSKVQSADGARAVLARNGDVMEVAANSAVELPVDEAGRPVKGVVQSLGTAMFKIITNPENPFTVKTPYLAAVIKGTTFSVTVNTGGTALHVTKGAVEVRSLLSNETSLIRAGQTALAASATAWSATATWPAR